MAKGILDSVRSLFPMKEPPPGFGLTPLPPSMFGGTHSPLPETTIMGRIKKLTRFQQSMSDLIREVHGDSKEDFKGYFDAVSIETVIEKMGWFNPVYGGRPKPFALHLLNGIPSPVPGKSFRWKFAGLMYFTPHVIGRRKSRARTTVAGLALLKYWKQNFPAFGKFYDAYWSAKAEREITLDCVQLACGITPPRFDKVIEANRIAALAHKVKMQKEMQATAQWKQAQANMQQTTYGYGGLAKEAMQQAVLNQQYQTMMQRQNQSLLQSPPLGQGQSLGDLQTLGLLNQRNLLGKYNP